MKHPNTPWQDDTLRPYPPLSGNIKTDVTIIGSGIAGVTTAYFLSKAGKRVVVIEKNKIQETTTAYTTAFLTSMIDTEYSELEHIFDKRTVKGVVESHERAIDTIEKISTEENIECEFKRVPHFSVALTQKGLDRFKKDRELLQSLGVPAICHFKKDFPFPSHGGIERPNQGKFHPIKYIAGLRKQAEKYGATFYENTEALHIDGKEIQEVFTSQGIITSKDVVVATYNPFMQPSRFLFKKGMYYSYVYELEIPKGAIGEGLYEDDHNPYHYFRIDQGENNDRMIIGGEDHRKEIPIDQNRNFNALEKYIQETFPGLMYRIVKRWRGPILEPSDGLPLIGRYDDKEPNRYVATAFSGNGMTYGTISGMLISDLILGKKNPWEDFYDPRRALPFKGIILKGRDYIEEFIKGVVKNIIEPLWEPQLFRPKRSYKTLEG
jgi:glycine/D-amino acid oxidase-like deaminating enzyme